MVGAALGRAPGGRGLRVVTFATERFCTFLRIWSAFPGISTTLGEVEVVAGDAVAERTAHDVRIANTRRFVSDLDDIRSHSRGLRPFWARRFEEIAARAVRDDLLLSDLDAFWLSDVRPEIEDVDYDLAFSVAHGTPANAVNEWGFALCCGLFATRANPATTVFMAEWSEWVVRMQHDQDAVNGLLLSNGVSWSAGPDDFLTTEVRIDNRPVKIAAMPERLARRAPPFSTPATRIAHPFLEREFFDSFAALYDILYQPSNDRAPVDTGLLAANLHILEDRFGISTGDDLWNLAALTSALDREPNLDACVIHAAVLYERLGADREAAELLRSQPPERLAQFPSAAVALQRLSDRGLASRERANLVSRSSSGTPRAVLRVGLGLARRGQLVSASLPISRALLSAGRERIGSIIRGMTTRSS